MTLQLGPSLNPDDIEEGDDCYFECIIKANPPTYKVVWKHNVSLSKYFLLEMLKLKVAIDDSHMIHAPWGAICVCKAPRVKESSSSAVHCSISIRSGNEETRYIFYVLSPT